MAKEATQTPQDKFLTQLKQDRQLAIRDVVQLQDAETKAVKELENTRNLLYRARGMLDYINKKMAELEQQAKDNKDEPAQEVKDASDGGQTNKQEQQS